MKAAPFEYLRVATLEQAVDELAKCGDSGKVLAGGQSLVPMLALRLTRPDMVVDIAGIEALDYVGFEHAQVRIGALATHRRVELEDAFKRTAVRDAVAQIGHVAIRNRGTVGGSLAHADPSAEWGALLLAFDGVVETVSASGSRVIPGEEFYLGPFETALTPAEMIREVRLRVPQAGVVSASAFVELTRRAGDFAVVGVAAAMACEASASNVVATLRVGVVGVGGRAWRATRLEERLVGTDLRAFAAYNREVSFADDLEQVNAGVSVSNYHRHALDVIGLRAIAKAAERIGTEAELGDV